MASFLRSRARQIAAALLIAAAYAFARPAAAPDISRTAGSLRFVPAALGDGLDLAGRSSVRRVHPTLRRIAGWISSVGAAVALADLDRDGLSNDACHVDPRTDTVTVLPVPGTGERYRRVRLDPPASSYDRRTIAPMGCLAGDMDEDGRLDLLVYYWGRTPVAFLARHDTPQPAYSAAEVMPGGLRWFTNAALFADLDGDGHADLLIANYFPDEAAILDAGDPGRAWMPVSMSRARNGGTKHVLRWIGMDGGSPRFAPADRWLPADARHGWALAAGAADLDGDLRPEVYIANDFGPDQLLHNRSSVGDIRFVPVEGRRRFTATSSQVLGRDSYKGMGVDFGDVNGDGRFDIYVSNIAAEYALEESHFLFVSEGDPAQLRHGTAPYVDRAEPLGLSRSSWAWDARLDDFDNDGTLEALQAIGFLRGDVNRWPELHELAMGNDAMLPNPAHWPRLAQGDDLSGHEHLRLFVRRAGDVYRDVASVVGLSQIQVTRGIAIADVDGDGRLDFAAANQWEPSRFYRNTTADAGGFLGLHVLFAADGRIDTPTHEAGHPTQPGSPGIGAVVTVRNANGRLRIAQVDGGNGHSGKRSPDVHIGLGSVPAGHSIDAELAWRTADGVRRARFTLPPGWHTVYLPRR